MELARIINNWDPEKLIMNGAPDDEYGSEIEGIFKHLPALKCDVELAELIQDVFSYSFGYQYPFSDCHRIAKRIFKDLDKIYVY